ncbi:peptidoglycan binding domain containing protein [Colletotrichum camelliae]|nr:peptidoglycan binding domain containing protein [Colletotrichum camelliae]
MDSNLCHAEQSKFWRSFVQPSTEEAEEISSGGLDFVTHDTPASAPQDFSAQAFPANQRCFRAPVEAEVCQRASEVKQKRIIICCDGTWQSSTTGVKNVPSNITRLYRSIARTGKDKTGKVYQQIAHYSAGIGTGDLCFIEKERQGAFGIGLTGDVIDAYNFIVNNYSPGDQIFCFGFSRGAYTARALAGLVTDIGIIQPREMQDFPDLYDKYRTHRDSHTFRQHRLYREWITGVRTKDGNPGKYNFMGAKWDSLPHTMPAESSRVVEVVGVFDTVGSLGIPNFTLTRMARDAAEKVAPILGIHNSGFHNHQLSPFIKHALHALALDERRKPFTPTLWWLAEDKERNPPKPERLEV